MFKNYELTIYYNVGERGYTAGGSNEHFAVTGGYEKGRLKLTLHPNEKIELVHAELSVSYDYKPSTRVMPNGYQSWTETREYTATERQHGLAGIVNAIPIGRKMAGIFGDYAFKQYSKKVGVSHGYTYGYLRDDDVLTLIGSMSERVGYTIINFDFNNKTVVLEKELEGKIIEADCDLYDIGVYIGSHDEVFDRYFADMKIAPPKVGRTCGYTSWYNYYTGITEEIAVRDLEGINRVGNQVDIYQIDDGYQSAVGDWQTCNEKFPKGMKYIADSIHEKGFKAGLWLAPFYIQKTSKVAADHPDWILKDDKGKPLFGFLGTRPCYTLDMYVPECAAYIKAFFNTILNEWGFDMVKLDFLYTACILPRLGKSRGELMCEAMDFLRECVGDKLILGCGVPLGPAFGKVDYCRIGSDVDLRFTPRPLIKLTNREIVSVQTAIKNTIFRRGLNGRAFGNDPDVFYLRDELKSVDGRKKSLGFTWEQKKLWAEICKNLGCILFTSDNVGAYDEDKLNAIIDTYNAPDKKIISASYLGNDTVELTYIEDGVKMLWTINWVTGSNSKTNI